MTPEEKRIAIAEAHGWTVTNTSHPAWRGLGFKENDIETGKPRWQTLPDYLHDRNAMAEAEETLVGRERGEYADRLAGVWMLNGEDRHPDLFAAVHATAAERADAFLYAKGLWRKANQA